VHKRLKTRLAVNSELFRIECGRQGIFRSLLRVASATTDLLQLAAKEAGQVRRLATHRGPIEGAELLESHHGLLLGKVPDHSDHPGVQGTVDRANGLEVLRTAGTKERENGESKRTRGAHTSFASNYDTHAHLDRVLDARGEAGQVAGAESVLRLRGLRRRRIGRHQRRRLVVRRGILRRVRRLRRHVLLHRLAVGPAGWSLVGKVRRNRLAPRRHATKLRWGVPLPLRRLLLLRIRGQSLVRHSTDATSQRLDRLVGQPENIQRPRRNRLLLHRRRRRGRRRSGWIPHVRLSVRRGLLG
jgi:hypothetical protein